MEKPFYEFDLTQNESLLGELSKMYEFCIDTSNYTNLIYRGVDIECFKGKFDMMHFNSYEELLEVYNEVYKFKEANPDQIFGQFSLFGMDMDWEDFPLIHTFIFSKFIEVYGQDVLIKKIGDESFSIKKTIISKPLLTMYKKGGLLSPHNDGRPTVKQNFFKPANILLYLNKGYNKDWGGCFVVDGIEVIPEYGKLIFLNFRDDNDPEHSVSMVTEDVNRIALLFNVSYSENEREIRKIV